MEPGIIGGIIGGLLATVALGYLSRQIKQTPARGELRYGWIIVALGVACTAFTVVATLGLILSDEIRDAPLAVIVLIAVFGPGSFWAFAEARSRGRFDLEGIEYSTFWSGAKRHQWDDLRSIAFSDSMKWYILRFKDGSKIRLSYLLIGHGEVLKIITARGFEVSKVR